MPTYVELPASTLVMSRSGLKIAKELAVGNSVLTADCVFDRIDGVELEEIESETVNIKAFVSSGMDIALPNTPYLTYNRKTKAAYYEFAKNLRMGSPILSCKPTMKYAKTCYSMDMNDFVTGFGCLKTVTFGVCTFTMRRVGEVTHSEKSKILVARLVLHGSFTVQTENGIVKSWGN